MTKSALGGLAPPPGFRLVRDRRTLALVREADAEALIQAGLLDPERLLLERDAEDTEPAEPLHDPGRRGGGRGQMARLLSQRRRPLLLKKYRRGGLAARILPDLFTGTRRMLDDLEASEHARAHGVASPAIVALVLVRRAGLVWSGYLVSEEVPGALTLAEAIERGAGYAAVLDASDPGTIGRREAWHGGAPGRAEGHPSRARQEIAPSSTPARREALAREPGSGEPFLVAERAIRAVRRLHDAGILHRDLNVRNVLVAGPEIFAIDFDGARVLPALSPAQRFSNLSRLDRSYVKHFGEQGPLSHADRRSLLALYCGEADELRREFDSRLASHKRRLTRHALLWRRPAAAKL